MEFGKDDKLWADLEQLTLESGTESLNIPTEFHRWNDLPTEMLRAVMQHMEFTSLMQLRGADRTMKSLVESGIYEFDYVKCTHWESSNNGLHFHMSAERHGTRFPLTMENDLFDQDYGFVPYSHIIQCMQNILKFGRIRALEVCYVPRHNFSEERLEDTMCEMLDQLEISAPFRFSNFVQDGISPKLTLFFLRHCDEDVRSIQLFHDCPANAPGVTVNMDELLEEPKFMSVPTIKILYPNYESYCQIAVLMAKKWRETDAALGQKILVAASTFIEPNAVREPLFQQFAAEFNAEITSEWEYGEDETGELRIQMTDRQKQILVRKTKGALFCAVVPASLRNSEVHVKFKKELEWLQYPSLTDTSLDFMVANI